MPPTDHAFPQDSNLARTIEERRNRQVLALGAAAAVYGALALIGGPPAWILIAVISGWRWIATYLERRRDELNDRALRSTSLPRTGRTIRALRFATLGTLFFHLVVWDGALLLLAFGR